ncbi:MAG: FMN-binding protein [Candidatus Cloacimonetes bacterium]|nr:FMN-binding protein [Candidatus Cloacimonadota bacterium]
MSDPQNAESLSSSDRSTPLSERYWYPVFFMLVVSIVFIGVLAVFYRSSEPRIKRAQEQAFRSQVLSLFAGEIGLLSGLSETELLSIENVDNNFQRFIESICLTNADITYYSAHFEGVRLGYCLDITGKGLWGTMSALVAMKPDLMTVINLSVYDQMETPGLGARITESWFRQQFAGKVLYDNDKPVTLSLVPEDALNPDPAQIRQVTGATITSQSVLKMLAQELTLIRDQVKQGLQP